MPAGTALRSSGDVTVTENGAVVDGLNVTGCIDVKANNVTIRRTKIRCGRPTTAIRLWTGFAGLLVEDTEIDGSGTVSAAVGFSDYTLRRVDIYNCIDGPRLASRTVMESSWVHDLQRTATSHNDTIQTTGGSGIVIRGNTLDVYNTGTDDVMNAALMMGSTTASSLTNVLVEGNFLNGGNYTLNIRPDTNAGNIVFRDNRFGTDFRYGPVARVDLVGVSFDDSNVWDATGKPVA